MMITAMDRLDREEARKLLGNSSGIILEEKEGTLSIGYVDYDVSWFGGRDYECFYRLDRENAERFQTALKKDYAGDLFEMCVEAFSVKFSNSRFEQFCAGNGITYTKSSY